VMAGSVPPEAATGGAEGLARAGNPCSEAVPPAAPT
jgi:hypothetical protein